MCLAALALTAACQNQPSKLDKDDPGFASATGPAAQPMRPHPSTTTPAPAHGGAGAAAAAAQPGDDEVAGTVVETMDASEYTYAKLDRNGTQVWVAGPKTALRVGQAIGPVKGTLMQGFQSTTLNRTFDQIYFIGSFPGGAGAAANPHAAPAPAATPPAAPIEKIEPAKGGMTVAQVFADKAKLSGKPVVVRGKVTKVNTGIMNKNWVHVQDGTGAAGTNDLLVTTAPDVIAKVGDVVTVRGTVSVDKDLGGGYKYAVLVEDATLAQN